MKMVNVKSYTNKIKNKKVFIVYPITYKENKYYVKVIIPIKDLDVKTVITTIKIYKLRKKHNILSGYKGKKVSKQFYNQENKCMVDIEFKNNLREMMKDVFQKYEKSIKFEKEFNNKLKEKEEKANMEIKQWDGRIE